MQELLLALEILLISAILSVDNALVIGLATRHLPNGVRQKAIFWGTMGAVGLRVVLSLIAVLLMDTPYLKLIGGLFLLYLAYKMLGDHEQMKDMRRGGGLMQAVYVIVIADFVVSIDNVLAVVGISKGNMLLLMFGIAVSIPCILWGSGLIVRLLSRYAWVMYAGVAVLTWTGCSMILEENFVSALVTPWALPAYGFHVIAVLATSAAGMWSNRRVA
ncbi:TerC family protein [Tumebacillus permanentifrigoris]|uniref:YjbE family integral membrane protein n=1 Tax=Tumebacillus permanentifrigoris TaxID=378543 RepID=A0A316D9E9_9BACL|nr:TerC family protein [Tumebacillus permanentifrigoris]PWK13380.1 YjbE family integral membrane protein [Tumebacillus permanentifrigoris]